MDRKWQDGRSGFIPFRFREQGANSSPPILSWKCHRVPQYADQDALLGPEMSPFTSVRMITWALLRSTASWSSYRQGYRAHGRRPVSLIPAPHIAVIYLDGCFHDVILPRGL